MDSPRFSSRASRARTIKRVRRGLVALLSLLWTSCATVKPQEKELLADPAMIYGSGGSSVHQEEHVLENREGATTGSASGGGCGCN